MAPAQARLAPELARTAFAHPAVPVVTNVDAAPVRTADAARDALLRQVCAPVRWVESVQCLTDCGVDRFVEVGPGKVLTGLVKKIAPGASVFNVEYVRDIEALASGLAGATM
jgi:[acyl-carrier-protein] S-malonyltransferase